MTFVARAVVTMTRRAGMQRLASFRGIVEYDLERSRQRRSACREFPKESPDPCVW
jgi:hypothetical protein